MTSSSSPQPRRGPGAPPGNLNALKHGFYSRQYDRLDLADLEAYNFAGLADEIALMRVFIRRVVDLGRDVDDLSQAVSLLRVLCLASASLSRLLKTQKLLTLGEDEFTQTIHRVLEEINREMEQTPSPQT
jgi:hypothetical protein